MFELLAIACSGLFAGAAIYISVVQQPAVRELGDATAAEFFPPMYRRAAPMQAGLALVGTLAGLVAWTQGHGIDWLLGALLLGSVVPITLLAIKPTNDRLHSPELNRASPEASELLGRWSRLHAIRTAASSLALVAFLCG